MSVLFNRGKLRIARDGFSALDVRALVLADADTLPAGASNPDLNTVAELLAVAGVTEASGAGYARVTVSGGVVLEDDAGDAANLDVADLSFPAVNAGRWVAMVFYVEGATDAARDLLSLHDLSQPLVTNGGDVSIQIPTNGIIGLT